MIFVFPNDDEDPLPGANLRFAAMQGSNCLRALKSVVPPLSYSSHKGVDGRIGVIGGSIE